MKATLAVLGLALFAVLAECKRAEEPAQNLLRKQILEKLAARGKLGEQNFGSEKSEVSEEDPEEPRWPYGWMEFAALYAKCESGSILIGEWGEYTNTALESVGIDGKDSVLAYACPGVMETGKILMEADDEGRKAAEPFLAMGLPVTQCVIQ
ncbi:hypothetical protein DPMN_110741 [Dreissena polymorpha]|uniref:Lipoprotein n=1 Tax=Dreissena polymorpha TaxID=45954 RepID=A0A9D4KD54_DREPO|nr:hypothetical protein DPMN_110741 [Dreissena polymorpha]